MQKSDEVQKNLISIELMNGSLVDLRGRISGPPDTPYEGGVFLLDIKIPETYPFNPPKVKFITRVWHPNISSATGAICLDILKDQWAAAMTIRTVLLSLQALLAAAEPDDPQDAVVAKQFKENIDLFRRTAKHWTEVYANHLQPLLLHSGSGSLVHSGSGSLLHSGSGSLVHSGSGSLLHSGSGSSSLYNHVGQQQWSPGGQGTSVLVGGQSPGQPYGSSSSFNAVQPARRSGPCLKYQSSNRDFDDKIRHLMEVTGSDEDRSRVALSSNSWNLEAATHSLIN